MAKKLTIAVLLALLPLAAFAQGAKPKVNQAKVVVSTSPAGPGPDGAAPDEAAVMAGKALKFKQMSLNEKIDSMDAPEMKRYAKKQLRVFDGDGDGKQDIQMKVAPGQKWRILWSITALSSKENGSFRIAVTAPSQKEYLQELKKGISLDEGESFGAIEVCEVSAGEFALAIEYAKTKVHLEMQALSR